MKSKVNGIKYQCDKPNHAFRQIIVAHKKIADFTCYEDSEMTTILIPVQKLKIASLTDAQAYIDALSITSVKVASTAAEMLEECAKRKERLYNIYSIYFTKTKMHHTPRMKDFYVVDKETTNTYVFNTNMEETYKKYAISTVEVQNEFLHQLSTLLQKRDISLLVKDVSYTYSNVRNVIFYSFVKIDDQICPNSPVPIFDTTTGNAIYEMEIQFNASFADFIAYERFRKDYQHYIFCSELLSFKTKGKAIVGWEDEKTPILVDYEMNNSVFWEPIDKSHTHQFQTNEKGNNAYPLDFQCKIRYNVVSGISEQMHAIKDIVCELIEMNPKGLIENIDTIKYTK